MVHVEAPGKTLITGGYLILDPNYEGIVLALSSKFHSETKEIFQKQLSEEQSEQTDFVHKIVINTPQINETSFSFEFKLANGFEFIPSLMENSKSKYRPEGLIRNCVLETFKTISNTISELQNRPSAIISHTPKQSLSLDITLKGDEQFYSSIKNKKLNISLKTGLGSSAALCSALTLSMISHFNRKLNLKMSREKLIDLAYKTSLAAHNNGQGAVGSGFDIAASFFGSILFKQKDIKPFNFPHPVIDLAIGDVKKGTKTKGMAKKFLEWKNKNPLQYEKIALKLKEIHLQIKNEFNEINNIIVKIENELELSKIVNEMLLNISLESFSLEHSFPNRNGKNEGKTELENSLLNSFKRISGLFIDSRNHYRRLGEFVEIDIEPENQRRILDKTNSRKGVIASFIPGAGGSDAIAALILRSEIVKENLRGFWRELGVEMVGVSVLPNGESIKIYGN